MSNHPIIHIEISANDREAAAKFYHDLFGWDVQQIPQMDYATFTTGEGSPGGGFNPVRPDNPPGTVLIYINTDNIHDTLSQAEKMGAKIIAKPQDIPGIGLFAIFSDPTGNKLALLQPSMEQQ